MCRHSSDCCQLCDDCIHCDFNDPVSQDIIECPDCNGNGFFAVHNDIAVFCELCRGTGVIRVLPSVSILDMFWSDLHAVQ